MNVVEPHAAGAHSHVFLAVDHAKSERRAWSVIVLCGAMMAAEIAGGLLFGSIALVADGLHMSTHAGALLLAALAYRYARRHASDERFSFGTGKLGDLAGFSSAIVLAMIAALIGYESVIRFVSPVPIHFAEAIPIACLGLAVNIASALILSARGHDHQHHGHGHHRHQGVETQRIPIAGGALLLELYEDGVPPRFRLRADGEAQLDGWAIETLRPDGALQIFTLIDQGDHLESAEEIPEPHAFTVCLRRSDEDYKVRFDEQEHDDTAADRDNNMRAAVIHVAADAAVSALVIVGLLSARIFGWLWMDPLAGIVGACVIASWSYGLVVDTGAILLDITPNRELAAGLRRVIEQGGDRLADLHLWRVGPGHLAAILSVVTTQGRDPGYYRAQLARFKVLSHLTIEVCRPE